MSNFKATVRVKNEAPWRYDNETGFLRCTIIVNTVGVLEYLRSEYPDLDPLIAEGRDVLRILVPAEALAEPDSLKSLEGMPIIVGHTYIDTTVREGEVSCGQMAGAASFDGIDVLCDAIVTDPITAARIMLPPNDPERLEEISSAGLWVPVWQPGVDLTGASYDGVFARMRYNHVALLAKGGARAGAATRVLNENRGLPKMSTEAFTRMRLRHGATVRIMNEDVPAVDDDSKKTDEEVKNKADPADLQAALARIDEINAQLEPLQKEKDDLAGQLQAMKEQIDAATSPEAIDSAASDRVEEREVANKVMNAAKLAYDPAFKSLRGHPLRVAVLNATRVANGRTVLDAEQAKNEAFVKGLWSGTIDALGVGVKKVDVTPLEGQQYAVLNAAPTDPRKAHATRLYGPVAKT